MKAINMVKQCLSVIKIKYFVLGMSLCFIAGTYLEFDYSKYEIIRKFVAISARIIPFIYCVGEISKAPLNQLFASIINIGCLFIALLTFARALINFDSIYEKTLSYNFKKKIIYMIGALILGTLIYTILFSKSVLLTRDWRTDYMINTTLGMILYGGALFYGGWIIFFDIAQNVIFIRFTQ